MNDAALDKTTTDDETKGKANSHRFRAMMDRERGEKAGELCHFVAAKFRPGGHNIRDFSMPINIEAIKEIAATIDITSTNPRDHIREPLIVIPAADGMLDIEAGETRWRAVLYLEGGEYAPNMRELPAKVPAGTIKLPAVQGKPGRALLERQLDTVMQVGRKPNDLELAEFFWKLHQPIAEGGEYGWSQAKIAEAINKPGQQTYVSQILSLRNPKIDPKVHEVLRAGRIASTTVINTYRDVQRSGGTPEQASKVILDEVAAVDARWNEQQQAEAAMIQAGRSAARSRSSGRSTSRSTSRASSRSGRGRAATAAPPKVTQRSINERIGEAVDFTRAPRAYNPANFNTFLVAIQREARESAWPATRERMNDVLNLTGYHTEPCLVDEKGDLLANHAEIKALHDAQVKRRAEKGATEPETAGTETGSDTGSEIAPREAVVGEAEGAPPQGDAAAETPPVETPAPAKAKRSGGKNPAPSKAKAKAKTPSKPAATKRTKAKPAEQPQADAEPREAVVGEAEPAAEQVEQSQAEPTAETVPPVETPPVESEGAVAAA